MHRRKLTGFTLIEMMVVVVIIGLLAALVVPRYIRQAEKAKRNTTKAQIKIIEQALAEFKLDTGRYPSTDEGLNGLVVKPSDYKGDWPKEGYLPEVPKDGWGNDFIYVCPGAHKAYDIISYGADGKEGGENENTDISN